MRRQDGRPAGLGWARAALAVALAGLVVAAPARAADDAEMEFWRSVAAQGDAAEYQAYLNAYPDGAFAALARLRLKHLAAQPAPVPTATATPATSAPADVAGVSLRPVRSRVRLVDGVVLDLDATALRAGSNLRIVVVPRDAPDAIGDVNAFARDSLAIEPRRLHLTVPPGPPGADEIRLYYVPQFASAYTVAARAPVTVEPGVPGAVLARDLAREAARVGLVQFEAAHRDMAILVQGAFLRQQPRTAWDTRWQAAFTYQEVARPLVAISLGMPGLVRDAAGGIGEVVCVVDASDPALLGRVAALRVGDPILVRGVPTIWDGDPAYDPVLLNRCALLSP